MSKKGSNNVLGGLSFVALILYSIATLLGRLKIEIGPFYWIAQILVLIVVFYTAWVFVRSKSQGWKVIFCYINCNNRSFCLWKYLVAF
jgi:cation transport ATPase